MTAPTRDAEVPAFWAALGLPGLADVHVHFAPPRLLRHVWDGIDETKIIYRWSDEELVGHLHALGVRAFTCLTHAHQAGIAADANAWTLDFAARTPGCIPGATFFPEDGVTRYTRAAIAAGARVFAVNARAFSPAHARLDAVWGLLADHGVPAVLETDPEPFGAVLRRHPRLRAIVAHLGAPDYVEFLALAEKYDGVCLDTTTAFTAQWERVAPFPRAHLPNLRELGLRGKVLLGTNFPSLPHPYAAQLAALTDLNLGDDWLAAVCWHNAARLFAPI